LSIALANAGVDVDVVVLTTQPTTLHCEKYFRVFKLEVRICAFIFKNLHYSKLLYMTDNTIIIFVHTFSLCASSGCYCHILFGLRKHLQLKQLPFVMGQGFNYIQFLNRFTIGVRPASI